MIWWFGVVVNMLASINEVNLHGALLVLRWRLYPDSVPSAGYLFCYVTNQPPKANSAFHLSGVGK